MTWLYGHLPSYAEWNRFCLFWRLGDGAIAGVTVDPDWDGGGESVNATNDFMRQMLTGYIEAELAGRPDLIEACTPHYPPGAKRMIRDNGVWGATLTRENVRLLDGGGIRAITPKGIVTADGTEEVVDVIIYGTGFTASQFLTPMTVTGRGGLDLHEHWAGDARAYLGVTDPRLPEPVLPLRARTRTSSSTAASCTSPSAAFGTSSGCSAWCSASGARALDVRRDVHDTFNEAVDAENRRMAWGVSDVNSWYKNDHGRVAQNWPFTLLEYWQRTAAPATPRTTTSWAELPALERGRAALDVRGEGLAHVVGGDVHALGERLDLERLGQRRRRRAVELALRHRERDGWAAGDRLDQLRDRRVELIGGHDGVDEPEIEGLRPLTILAVYASSFALCTPMRCRSSHDVPKSRLRPRFAKIAEKRARSEHQVRSAASASPNPAPTQARRPSTRPAPGRRGSRAPLRPARASRSPSSPVARRCRRSPSSG